ncbi:hypothetical protein [Anaeromyxobacter paludicola]|uniref:Lipoprotein n=1 Tax=Anaeromyxobacter paludicola TaxID=2918171 RepID=A0ABN6N753_9BACT|nr:hypothetical protein [Anaeromyxobacter paludicola]BDG08994.1 hypothetical protein AMPC_21070 [Anaeromyxobacter paludicola]
MRGRALGTLLLLAACGHAGGPAPGSGDQPPSAAVLPRPIGGSPDQPPVAPVIPGSTWRGERARCLDLELARRGLNEFGDPVGTPYAGGSPLYDGVTGTTAERYDYVARRHPDIGTRCSMAPLEGPVR